MDAVGEWNPANHDEETAGLGSLRLGDVIGS